MLWMPIVKMICIQRLIYDSITIVTKIPYFHWPRGQIALCLRKLAMTSEQQTNSVSVRFLRHHICLHMILLFRIFFILILYASTQNRHKQYFTCNTYKHNFDSSPQIYKKKYWNFMHYAHMIAWEVKWDEWRSYKHLTIRALVSLA